MSIQQKLKRWLLQGYQPEGFYEGEEAVAKSHHTHPWWKVMCLTGVDYFSTLGYQPGIAFLAAGALSPIATLLLVILTLFGALPMYKRVAIASPHGDGSISMLEKLLPFWQGKLFVLSLIGFAATGFIITITLSAADAAAHVVENPLLPHGLERFQVPITLLLIFLLGIVFLKGFGEAIGIAVGLVGIYIICNMVVIGRGFMELAQHPELLNSWQKSLFTAHANPLLMLVAAVMVFPQLALGLSGFETGVVVMPLVKGDPDDLPEKPAGRIRNAGKLLTTAAVLMSLLLMGSSTVTSMIVPAREFEPELAFFTATEQVPTQARVKGKLVQISPEQVSQAVVKPHKSGGFEVTIPAGAANGRAMAYLAHKLLPEWFGTAYDIITVLILWFAGASAMAGLLNIVPRYLPRYGMAPEWTRANRPLVLIYTAICFVVTLIFEADVDKQAAAYATGVLALMTSATVAVTIAAYRAKEKLALVGFGIVTVIFIYTMIVNIRADIGGLRIALFFIGSIIAVSLVSRIWRLTELRVDKVEVDEKALEMLAQMAKSGEVRFIANHPDEGDAAEYSRVVREAAWTHHFRETERWAILEVYVADSSEFSTTLRVEGIDVEGFWVIRCHGAAVPNAIAALTLEVQKRYRRRPHVYFHWIESNPLLFFLRFVILGEGDIAPLTHEILRRNEPDPGKRPIVHAAG